jgi:hypothetical protein
MSLRTYAIPLALVSLGIGLGVISDRSPEVPDLGQPAADLQAPPLDVAPTEVVPVNADLANDPHYALPSEPLATAPQAQEGVLPGDGSMPIAEGASEVPISEVADAPVEIPTEEIPVGDAQLPDGILPGGIVQGQPYPPADGETPYEVVTTNPMACIPEGAPGCFSGVSCCGDLVCIEDACVQSH